MCQICREMRYSKYVRYYRRLCLHLSGTPSLKTSTSPLAVNYWTTVYFCISDPLFDQYLENQTNASPDFK